MFSLLLSSESLRRTPLPLCYSPLPAIVDGEGGAVSTVETCVVSMGSIVS